MPDPCVLCGTLLTPILDSTPSWLVALNVNQNLLGKIIIVLARHEESVTALTPAEWVELQGMIIKTSDRLRAAFAPDHFNYAFLQNQDRHVHLHVIPRYAEPRHFAGVKFDDPDYPDHYAVPAPNRRLDPQQMTELAKRLTEA